MRFLTLQNNKVVLSLLTGKSN